MSYFLGVDGGGTKTALCLVSAAGALLARVEAPGCYYLDVAATAGVGLVAQVLGAAVPAVCAEAGIEPADITYAFFGLPAYGEVSADIATLDRAPRAVLGHDRYRCDNDMVCGWAGSLALADGINVISGTGSMAYGRRGALGARVGGWGERFGDEGSGYWIGVRGLQTFAQMSDGRQPVGPLADLMRAHLGLSADLEAIDVVLNRWRSGRRAVAGVAPVVAAAARVGDTAATQILTDAAAELVALVDTARSQLGFAETDDVPVSYSGGVFAIESVRTAVTAALGQSAYRYRVQAPHYDPVIGAALYAAQLAGEPLDAEALWRLSR